MTDSIFSCEGLVKKYPGVVAVDGVSLKLGEGVCLGLLGPNGAGKSSTVDMCTGLVKPDAGTVLFRGRPRGKDYQQRIGVVFQIAALQDFLTTKDVLRLFSSFYQHTLPLEEVISRCGLKKFLDRDNRKLSGGQRQRLYLALALLNDPELLFLDEPTTGLDPHARRLFWELIDDIKGRGKSILLTTHYMEEAYTLCDEVILIDHGRVIAQGSPRGLLQRYFQGTWLDLPRSSIPEARWVDLQDESTLPFTVSQREDQVTLQTSKLNDTFAYLLRAGVSLDELHLRTASLDDLFVTLTSAPPR